MGCKDEDKVYKENMEYTSLLARVFKCSFGTSRHGEEGQGLQFYHRVESLGTH